MEQHDLQLKVPGSTLVANKDHGDDLREMMRAIEDVLKNDPNFFDVQVPKANPRVDLRKVLGGLNKDYGNFHVGNEKAGSLHPEHDGHTKSRKIPSHPFDPSVFQVHEPLCQNCSGELEFTLVENLNDTGVDWIQWFCKNTCGYYYNVQLI